MTGHGPKARDPLSIFKGLWESREAPEVGPVAARRALIVQHGLQCLPLESVQRHCEALHSWNRLSIRELSASLTLQVIVADQYVQRQQHLYLSEQDKSSWSGKL